MEVVILQPAMDTLGDFHGTPPLWIFLNVIMGLSYLQEISWENASLSWQAVHAFEDPKDPHYWGGSILTSCYGDFSI